MGVFRIGAREHIRYALYSDKCLAANGTNFYEGAT